MLKTPICALLLLLAFSSNGQLISASDKSKSLRFDTCTYVYLSYGYLNTFRELTPNSDHLNTPLGERANEIPSWLSNFSLRIATPFLKILKLNGGIEFQQNGESYNWNSEINDSSYAYQTSFRYISMPIHLSLEYGKKITVYASSGISPGIFSSYLQKQQWQDSDGSNFSDEIKIQNDCNSFVVSFQGDLGFHYHLKSNFGIQMTAHYRRQLNNTYKEFEDYIHKAYALGLSFSVTYRL